MPSRIDLRSSMRGNIGPEEEEVEKCEVYDHPRGPMKVSFDLEHGRFGKLLIVRVQCNGKNRYRCSTYPEALGEQMAFVLEKYGI